MSDDQYARTARVMFLLVWAILFIGLFLFFYYQGQPEKQTYIAGRSEMVLSAGKDGHYHVKGAINDYPVTFLVDTGATLVAIPQNIADSLHIKGSYPLTMMTANGEVTGDLTRVQKLSFGEFSLEDIKVVIMPSSSDDEVLLGMNVLSKFNIEQQNKKLIIKRIN